MKKLKNYTHTLLLELHGYLNCYEKHIFICYIETLY